VEITWVAIDIGDRRENNVIGLKYTDDVNWSIPIEVNTYNMGIPTSLSSYIY
jgi:hypothetical protein